MRRVSRSGVAVLEEGRGALDEAEQVGDLDLLVALLLGQLARVHRQLVELLLPAHRNAGLLELLDQAQRAEGDQVRLVLLQRLAAALLLRLLEAALVRLPVLPELYLRVLAVDGGLAPRALLLQLLALPVEVHPLPLGHRSIDNIMDSKWTARLLVRVDAGGGVFCGGMGSAIVVVILLIFITTCWFACLPRSGDTSGRRRTLSSSAGTLHRSCGRVRCASDSSSST